MAVLFTGKQLNLYETVMYLQVLVQNFKVQQKYGATLGIKQRYRCFIELVQVHKQWTPEQILAE